MKCSLMKLVYRVRYCLLDKVYATICNSAAKKLWDCQNELHIASDTTNNKGGVFCLAGFCKLVAYVVWRKDAVSDRLIIAFVHGQNTVRGPCTWICLNKLTHEVTGGQWKVVKSTNKEPKEATKWRPLRDRELIDCTAIHQVNNIIS